MHGREFCSELKSCHGAAGDWWRWDSRVRLVGSGLLLRGGWMDRWGSEDSESIGRTDRAEIGVAGAE